MNVYSSTYICKEETLLKSLILVNGVEFTSKALNKAAQSNAKQQNLVYNMPIASDRYRPQELNIKNSIDGYEVVVSCVASNGITSPVLIDVNEDDKLFARYNNDLIPNIELSFVQTPSYYNNKLSNNINVTNYITACGYDELNIIPWKGCNISDGCLFCGINNFIRLEDISAQKISKGLVTWDKYKQEYIPNLLEALDIAIESECYDEHLHAIMISGNLSNDKLDEQAQIYSEIAKSISPILKERATEGLVAVISPPNNLDNIDLMKKSGIEKVVFNLEAISPKGFQHYCPGKAALGREYFIDRLIYAVNIFGKGNVWTNLVVGLEPIDEVLSYCKNIIDKGIVVSGNVLHLDKGNKLDCNVPDPDTVLDFYYQLNILNNTESFNPFYCSKALRTSLTNEAFDSRIILR